MQRQNDWCPKLDSGVDDGRRQLVMDIVAMENIRSLVANEPCDAVDNLL